MEPKNAFSVAVSLIQGYAKTGCSIAQVVELRPAMTGPTSAAEIKGSKRKPDSATILVTKCGGEDCQVEVPITDAWRTAKGNGTQLFLF